MLGHKTVYFENINFLHFFLLLYHVLRGHKIKIFDFTCRLKRSRILRKLINDDRITRIYIPNVDDNHGTAIEQTVLIFEQLSGNRISSELENIYQDKEANLILKKDMVKGVFRCIYISRFFSKIIEKEKECEVLFIQDKYKFYENLINKYGSLKIALPDELNISMLSKVSAIVYFPSLRVAFILKVLAMLLRLCRAFISRKNDMLVNCRTDRFKHVIAINAPFFIKFKGNRKFDFLLDNQHLKKEDTLFLFTFQPDVLFINKLIIESYNFAIADKLKDSLKLLNFRDTKLFAQALLKCFGAILFVSGQEIFLLKAYLMAIVFYYKWGAILQQFLFKNYVYTNNESYEQVAVNIVVRKRGGTTWNYSSFIGGTLLYAESKDFLPVRHILWSFLNSDYYLSVNDDVSRYLALHHQSTTYKSIGCIYSELIKDCKNTDFALSLFSDLGVEGKVVSFFDTTFVDFENGITTYDDCIAFYEDILTIAEDMPNLYFIIKPAKDFSFYFTNPAHQWSSCRKGIRIIKLMEELKSKKRVCWAGHDEDTVSIIASSDVVITHCMSSPTMEALGARKKAFWYESGNKHSKINYNAVPGLIMHGYSSLKSRVGELIDMGDEEYSRYLEQYIKGGIESNLDGKALTRFRKLLAQNT